MYDNVSQRYSPCIPDSHSALSGVADCCRTTFSRINNRCLVLVVYLVCHHVLGRVDDLFRRSFCRLRWTANAARNWTQLAACDTTRDAARDSTSNAAVGAAANSDGDFQAIRGTGKYLRIQSWNVDALGLILIRGWYDLNDLVTRKLQARNIHRRTVHEIGIQNSENRLVRDDQQIALFTLQLENNWLESHSQIMIGLSSSQISKFRVSTSEAAYFCTRISMMIRIELVFFNLFRIYLSDDSF